MKWKLGHQWQKQKPSVAVVRRWKEGCFFSCQAFKMLTHGMSACVSPSVGCRICQICIVGHILVKT